VSDDPRRVALSLLRRIEDEGAFANLVVPSTLDRSDLSRSDRAMVTDLVYGTARPRCSSRNGVTCTTQGEGIRERDPATDG